MKTLKIYAFDNGGETLDRYTLINREGDMLGLSDDPTHPLGFSQFVGNCIDNYMNVSYGYSWRRQCDVKKIIKIKLPEIIHEFKSEGNLGKMINFEALPENIKTHTLARFEVY